MDFEALLLCAAGLLYGGIFLAWGRRAAGLAMLATFALGVAGLGVMFALHAWGEHQAEVAREEQAARKARQEEERLAELERTRAACVGTGGTWWPVADVCESAEEAAARLEEERRLAQERRRREETERVQAQKQANAEAARQAAQTEVRRKRNSFDDYKAKHEREALILAGGSEFLANRMIQQDVAKYCGDLGGTPRSDGMSEVTCGF
ncbi:MAG: hypothetical protein R3F16_22870 [Myxococcota bacterium]